MVILVIKNGKSNEINKKKKTRKRVKFYRDYKIQLQKEENQMQNFLSKANNSTSSEDTSQNINEIEENCSFENKLKEWVIKYKIQRTAVTDLLKILRSAGLKNFPEDSKTFMQTPRNVEIISSCNGSLWYYGIEKSFRVICHNIDRDLELLLNFNIDGLPLFQSSTVQFWPVCVNI